MLEIPESYTLARQLEKTLKGKSIKKVVANSSPHGFAFFFGDPAQYPELLEGRNITGAAAYGGLAEVSIEDIMLVFGDGVNVRYLELDQKKPAKHQLYIEFEDSSSIVCTIQMYGGMWAFPHGLYDNPYYAVAKEKPSPLSEEFDKEHFSSLLSNVKPTISAKAFLATEQRIPGLGNGVLQDILFSSAIHPKQKLNSLSSKETDRLFVTVKNKLAEMTALGGRDTEKDLFGQSGGYRTILSSKTLANPCPQCFGEITRQAFLGGNVYFCPNCQPLL